MLVTNDMADDLWDAIISGNANAAKTLLEETPKLVHHVAAEGQTALHLACDVNVEGHECVQLLVERNADVHVQDARLRTPLLVACEVGAMGAAQFLMQHAPSIVSKGVDENGMTVAHWLASQGAAELLGRSLELGCAVDATNSTQQTPLHLAISRGHLACSLVLLDAGANPGALDSEQRTAMHLAMQTSGGMGACSESTLLLLRLLQLDSDGALAKAVDADRRTPLHWACGKNALPCVRALLHSGADVDAVDWAGRTPLHWAVLVDAAESATELLASGAAPAITDRDERTPLHWAADRASKRCLSLLLNSCPPEAVDATDWGGYSALHYAARRGALGCVKLLLSRGASRRLVAMNGEIPVDLTTCRQTAAQLIERVGMKRQRSLSSSNSLVLCTILPDLARQFYDAWEGGDLTSQLVPALQEPGSREGRALTDLMKRHPKVSISDMHVCPKANKVVVELTTSAATSDSSTNGKSHGGNDVRRDGSGKGSGNGSGNGSGDHPGESSTAAMHSLTFTEEGLVSRFVPYGLLPTQPTFAA